MPGKCPFLTLHNPNDSLRSIILICKAMKTSPDYPLCSNVASWLAASLLLAGCATSGPPTQEMSDARQALDAARQVNAARHVPETLQDAQSLLSQAEEKLGEGAFAQAQHDALAAKAGATKARTMASAISEAKAALREAEAVDALSGGAIGLLQQAEAAALMDDDKATVRLAHEATQQAARDVNHALLGRTRILLDEAHALMDGVPGLPPYTRAQQAEMDAIEAMYQREEGRAAYAAARRLVEELREAQRVRQAAVVAQPPAQVTATPPKPLPEPAAVNPIGAPHHYTVRHGDSLWKIAARPEVYANPLRWVGIYQANRHHVKNANAIYPGQVLLIPD